MSVRTLCKDHHTLRKIFAALAVHIIVAPLPFIVSELQVPTGMVDSASQAEDILEDDGDIRRTRTTAVGRKRSPSETVSRRRFTCQA